MLIMQNHRGSQMNRRFSHFFVRVVFAKAAALKVAYNILQCNEMFRVCEDAMSQTDDSLTRFILDGADVRGALVKLTRTWQAIESRADYPAPVAGYLAQCAAASALAIASIKTDGRLSI